MMTAKKWRFVEEYIKDLNATQAAIRAGYSARTAASQGERLLRDVDVSAAIHAALAERSKRVEVDADYVLKRLAEIDKMDAADILKDDGSIKPVQDWPPIWRQMISGLEMTELFEGRGDQREMVGILKKIKWPDKVKNLELIGRHVGVQAFKDRVEHSGSIKGMAERMRRRRKTKA